VKIRTKLLILMGTLAFLYGAVAYLNIREAPR
jgi:hypothetical protein